MRAVDETCSARIDGHFLILEVPGCTITHRFVLDRDWYDALKHAFDLCSRRHFSEKARDESLRKMLATRDEPLSAFEKRIIFDNATGRGLA